MFDKFSKAYPARSVRPQATHGRSSLSHPQRPICPNCMRRRRGRAAGSPFNHSFPKTKPLPLALRTLSSRILSDSWAMIDFKTPESGLGDWMLTMRKIRERPSKWLLKRLIICCKH